MGGLRRVAAAPLASGAQLVISAGSVVDFGRAAAWPVESVAIVNAANRGGQGGGGVDGAIGRAGGPALKAARRALPVVAGSRVDRIATGGAAATGPGAYGDLAAAYVIHAVGPNYGALARAGRPLAEGDALLRAAYGAALDRAREAGVAYVGFALLSAGVFRGARPLAAVLDVAVAAVAARAVELPALKEVHLVAFGAAEQALLAASLDRLPPAPRPAANSLGLRRGDSLRAGPGFPAAADAGDAPVADAPPAPPAAAPPPPPVAPVDEAARLLAAMDAEHRRVAAAAVPEVPADAPGRSLLLRPKPDIVKATPPPARRPPPPPPMPAGDAAAVRSAMRGVAPPPGAWPAWAKDLDDEALARAALGETAPP